MALEPIFDAVRTRLAADVPDVVFKDYEALSHMSRPPYISWTPTNARHLSPRRVGGGPGDDGPILTRQWAIEVTVWAENFEKLEELVDVFLGVAHEVLSQHSYKPGEEVWRPGGATTESSMCIITFFLLTPILRRPLPTRPIDAINATYTLETTP